MITNDKDSAGKFRRTERRKARRCLQNEKNLCHWWSYIVYSSSARKNLIFVQRVRRTFRDETEGKNGHDVLKEIKYLDMHNYMEKCREDTTRLNSCHTENEKLNYLVVQFSYFPITFNTFKHDISVKKKLFFCFFFH